MNDIILDTKELENVLYIFRKDIIEDIEHKRRKEPLKENEIKYTSELLEHIEKTREKRRATRIMISRLHKCYNSLGWRGKKFIELRYVKSENLYTISGETGRKSRALNNWKNNALNEILNKYNELLEIDIDESLFDDIYFLDV